MSWRAGEWGVRVTGDVRVTDPEAVKGGYTAGVLKAIVLSRGLCVCFAGTPVTAALDAVRRQVDRGSDVLSVEQGLLTEHRQHGGVEFLVAALGPSRLSVVKGGELRGPVPNGWIGHHDAFSAYQKAFHEHQPSSPPPGYEARRDELDAAFRMMAAMDQVIEDDAVPSVGETAIHVVPDSGGFRYSNGARMVVALCRSRYLRVSRRRSDSAAQRRAASPIPL